VVELDEDAVASLAGEPGEERNLLDEVDLPSADGSTVGHTKPGHLGHHAAGDGYGAATPRWFANSGKSHTYEVRGHTQPRRNEGGRRRSPVSVAPEVLPLFLFASLLTPTLLCLPSTHQVLRVDKNGVTVKQELRRRELLKNTGLPARDLRRIDPALALTTSAPTLLVSDQVLLINLGQVR
jgi:hypothetical protein